MNYLRKLYDILDSKKSIAEQSEEIEEYAKNHNKIKIIHCSDDGWISSIIVMVPFYNHRSGSLWKGVAMLSIPQNGDEPIVMNLYQNQTHKRIDQMIQSLEEIKAELDKDE